MSKEKAKPCITSLVLEVFHEAGRSLNARPASVLERYEKANVIQIQTEQWWLYSLSSIKGFLNPTNEELIDCAELCQRKNQAYGSRGLYAFGTHGIRIRSADKLYRYMHLTTHGGIEHDESLRDSLLDLLNYAALAILVLRKQLPCAD